MVADLLKGGDENEREIFEECMAFGPQLFHWSDFRTNQHIGGCRKTHHHRRVVTPHRNFFSYGKMG
jgi:hypothetical protein